MLYYYYRNNFHFALMRAHLFIYNSRTKWIMMWLYHSTSNAKSAHFVSKDGYKKVLFYMTVCLFFWYLWFSRIKKKKKGRI